MRKSILICIVASLSGLAGAQGPVNFTEDAPNYVRNGARYSENTQQWFTVAVQAVNTTSQTQQFSASFNVRVPIRVWETSSSIFAEPLWHNDFKVLSQSGTGAVQMAYHYFNGVLGAVGPHSSVYGYGWITTESGTQAFYSFNPVQQTPSRERYVPKKAVGLEPGYSVSNGSLCS